MTVNEEAEKARNDAIQKYKSSPFPSTDEQWVDRAKEIASILKIDAAERDAARETPFKEINLLKAAGFINSLGPKKYGGHEIPWELAYQLIVEVAVGDSSIGHLLGNHLIWFWTATFFGTPEQQEKWTKILTEENAYIGGAVNARNKDLVIERKGDEIIFNGKKYFSTGSVISDYLVLEGVLPDGQHVFVYAPGDHKGIKYLKDWNAIGQRLTESGGVVIENVDAKWEDALGFSKSGEKVVNDPYSTFIVPTIQLAFVSFHLGIAKGALSTAAEYTRKYTRSWPYGGDKEKGVDEWYIREGYGVLAAKVFGAEEFHKSTVKELAKHLKVDRKSLSERKRGELAARVAATKLVVAETALEVTSKIFELTGARSTLSKNGLDRFWRNIRTHTLHDPIPYKKYEVGSFYLLDEIPQPTWYT